MYILMKPSSYTLFEPQSIESFACSFVDSIILKKAHKRKIHVLKVLKKVS